MEQQHYIEKVVKSQEHGIGKPPPSPPPSPFSHTPRKLTYLPLPTILPRLPGAVHGDCQKRRMISLLPIRART